MLFSRTLDRREMLVAGVAFAGLGASSGAYGQRDALGASARADLARIEAEVGGRLGVFLRDFATGRRYRYRAAERFPMCSTFKLLASAAVLARTDAGVDRLDRMVRFTTTDLVAYSPVTETRVATGMTLAELCEAAITRSDNTAGNLLLESLGGPDAVTAYARSLGDGVTRLDRTETSLNEAKAGDPRDTTSPAAMAGNLQALVLGRALSPSSRERLTTWLIANRTGGTRLRAGLPRHWRVGDKTGAGGNGTTNDVAVIWRPDRAPLILCTYLTGSNAADDARNATLAAVAKVATKAVGG